MEIHGQHSISNSYGITNQYFYGSECYRPEMDFAELREHRKKRLHDLVEIKFNGNKAALGRALGFHDGAYINQLLSGHRAISEKTVDRIQSLPGLHDWFSMPAHDSNVVREPTITYAVGTTYDVITLARKASSLPETQRRYLAMLLTDLVMEPEKAEEIAPEIGRLLQQPLGKPIQQPSTTLKNGSSG